MQWLRAEATRPEVRTLVLRQLGDAWDDEAEARNLPAIRSVLQEVIATETNRWIRAVAREELRELDE